jgi:hypothetical protein
MTIIIYVSERNARPTAPDKSNISVVIEGPRLLFSVPHLVLHLAFPAPATRVLSLSPLLNGFRNQYNRQQQYNQKQQ